MSANNHWATGTWTRVTRGMGERDEQGLWHPAYGLWHYAPAKRSAHGWQGAGIAGLCGSDLYRRNDRDVVRLNQIEPPEGKVCAKCVRLLATPTTPP